MSDPLIKVVDIWKTYDLGAERVHALKGVNFEAHSSEYIAIIGQSGSGKSTLMNLIGCLDTPSQGRYLLNGKAVSQMNDDELARVRNEEIGFIFQTFNLLSRQTAQRNVEMPLIYAGVPASERVERATHALEAVGLGDRKNHRPNELSGGQRQRVAIARALVSEPSLLLADEPTGNLDNATGHDILHLFDKLHDAGNTIVIVTHNPEIAERAQRVITLLDGQVAGDDKAA